jgi:hypothetical protein
VGHEDLSARQGHYIDADDEKEARTEMQRRYPEDKDGFDIQFWKGHSPTCWGVPLRMQSKD